MTIIAKENRNSHSSSLPLNNPLKFTRDLTNAIVTFTSTMFMYSSPSRSMSSPLIISDAVTDS